jgi:hypothetical protein
MPTPNPIDWNAQSWTDALNRSLAANARCRSIIPKGIEQIGANTVTVPVLKTGDSLEYDNDKAQSTLHIYVKIVVDDQHVSDSVAVMRLIEAGGAALGAREDHGILHGPSGGPPPPKHGDFAKRNPGLECGQIVSAAAVPSTPIGLGQPNGHRVLGAISLAKTSLDVAGRPGSYGLILHHSVAAALNIPPTAGAAPVIQAVEQIIGSNQITGTSALDGKAGEVCGVLFRLAPPAIDLVQTRKPSLREFDRRAGETNLRVEEDIALRVLDPVALHYLRYG